jgi:hypothetical protein
MGAAKKRRDHRITPQRAAVLEAIGRIVAVPPRRPGLLFTKGEKHFAS